MRFAWYLGIARQSNDQQHNTRQNKKEMINKHKVVRPCYLPGDECGMIIMSLNYVIGNPLIEVTKNLSEGTSDAG